MLTPGIAPEQGSIMVFLLQWIWGKRKTFNKIVIDSGSGSNDYARNADVFVSTDGTNWTKVSSVTGTGPVQEVTFQTQTARYIKVV